MTFPMAPLHFDRSAIAPLMSAETFSFHYDKHYAAYVKNLNGMLDGSPYAGKSMEEIVRMSAQSGDKKAFNNSGQAWNHAFFWASINAVEGGAPQGDLGQAIHAAFGSFDGFVEKFTAEGVAHFGSGWVWLSSDRAGALKVHSTHDAEPAFLIDGMTPLIVCDLWEHAYYIDWRNDRKSFVESFAKTRANWQHAAAQHAAATSGAAGWVYPS